MSDNNFEYYEVAELDDAVQLSIKTDDGAWVTATLTPQLALNLGEELTEGATTRLWDGG